MKNLLLLGLTMLIGAWQTMDQEKTDPDTLKANIKSLRPENHTWRKIPWQNCPLEALKESRDKKKPVLIWVFLGKPSDERC